MRRPRARIHQAGAARARSARHGTRRSRLIHHRLHGHIGSAGFASGDRIVIGVWHRSPIGPFADIMWGTSDGERVLVSSHERAERFITAVYEFDRTVVTPIEVEADERRIWISAPPLEIELVAGSGWRIPGPRPLWFTRWVEDPAARLAMGVNTYGVSPTGVTEWYQATIWRPVVEASARLDGADLGVIAPLDPPLGVGFTDPPRRPSIVTVSPILADPSGALDRLLGASGRT